MLPCFVDHCISLSWCEATRKPQKFHCRSALHRSLPSLLSFQPFTLLAKALHGTCCPNCVTQRWTQSCILAHQRYSQRCYCSIVEFLNADDDTVKAARRQELKDKATRKFERAPHLPVMPLHGPLPSWADSTFQTSLDFCVFALCRHLDDTCRVLFCTACAWESRTADGSVQ